MNHIEGHRVIGSVAWDKLVSYRGGCEYDVPANLDGNPGARLSELIGKNAAKALIKYAGGDTIYIAVNWEKILATRYADIVARHEAGETPNEIALRYTYVGRYTERQIRMVLHGRPDILKEGIPGAQLQIPGI